MKSIELRKGEITYGKIVQTAGQEQLGEFAPNFAHYNDNILFGENWNNPAVDTKMRCIVTVTALLTGGTLDNSLAFHLENAQKHGVSKAEIAAVITHLAFYAGWSKAWSTFKLAQEIWHDETLRGLTAKEKHEETMLFPIGDANEAYAAYFSGQSYLAPISTK